MAAGHVEPPAEEDADLVPDHAHLAAQVECAPKDDDVEAQLFLAATLDAPFHALADVGGPAVDAVPRLPKQLRGADV